MQSVLHYCVGPRGTVILPPRTPEIVYEGQRWKECRHPRTDISEFLWSGHFNLLSVGEDRQASYGDDLLATQYLFYSSILRVCIELVWRCLSHLPLSDSTGSCSCIELEPMRMNERPLSLSSSSLDNDATSAMANWCFIIDDLDIAHFVWLCLNVVSTTLTVTRRCRCFKRSLTAIVF